MKFTLIAAMALSTMAIARAMGGAQALPPAITLDKILALNVKSADLKRSAKFYSEVFGYRIVKMIVQSPEGATLASSLDEQGVHWVLMEGPFPIVLVATSAPTPLRFDGIVPSFRVTELDEAFETAQRLGMKILKPIQRFGGPKDFGFFIVADPDGNPLDIIQLSQGAQSIFDEPIHATGGKKQAKKP
jgi:predicted enzyme related to lactoylglutathione lyase